MDYLIARFVVGFFAIVCILGVFAFFIWIREDENWIKFLMGVCVIVIAYLLGSWILGLEVFGL